MLPTHPLSHLPSPGLSSYFSWATLTHLPSWKDYKGNWEGQGRARGEGSFFSLSGSTGTGNEVIMLLMGRDKQADQCVCQQ